MNGPPQNSLRIGPCTKSENESSGQKRGECKQSVRPSFQVDALGCVPRKVPRSDSHRHEQGLDRYRANAKEQILFQAERIHVHLSCEKNGWKFFTTACNRAYLACPKFSSRRKHYLGLSQTSMLIHLVSRVQSKRFKRLFLPLFLSPFSLLAVSRLPSLGLSLSLWPFPRFSLSLFLADRRSKRSDLFPQLTRFHCREAVWVSRRCATALSSPSLSVSESLSVSLFLSLSAAVCSLTL